LRAEADDGREFDIGGGVRLRAVLARLALDRGRVVSSAELIDGVWGDEQPVDANNALQRVVSRLRKALRDAGADDVVESDAAGYRLVLAPEDVDVSRFEQLVARGRTELRTGQPRHGAVTLRTALRLWRGQPLADVADAPFAGPASARLVERWHGAIEDRIEADLSTGHGADLVPELDELVAAHPLRERLAGLWLRALCAAGRQADALAGYQRIRQALADSLGVDPSAELQDLHLAVLRRDPALFAPTPAGLPVARAPIPARLTSFVGRERDLATVAGLMERSRLVCLAGPGGAGKTRLATEVAARHLDADGTPVWFIELATSGPGSGPGDLAQEMLPALGVRDVRVPDGSAAAAQPRDPVDQLTEAFGQPGVLVLDNCEHVIESAAALVETLLTRCPALRVLVTSREPLAITGEALHWVGPLELPTEDATDPNVVAATSAVRLFVDRASAVSPDFTLDAETLPDVVEICRALDGLPLALELAAARLRSMSPRQVSERLVDRFQLLDKGNRTAQRRHRTLRAVVQWSWELLGPAEQRLARRLAVFPAGCRDAAAIEVCAGDGLPATEIPDLLAGLVEKSLLEFVPGQPRYRMLQTVRAFGVERLTEAGEWDTTRRAFARYITRFAEHLDPVLRKAAQLDALAALTVEHGNVIAAVRYAIDLGEIELAARLVAAMVWFWSLSGNSGEVRSWAGPIVALDTSDRPSPAMSVLRMAELFTNGGLLVTAEKLAETRAVCVRDDVVRRYPTVLLIDPLFQTFNGQNEPALASIERMLDQRDPWIRAAARLLRCFVADNAGDMVTAEADLDIAIDQFRTIGERWGLAFALTLRGQYLSLRGDHAGALETHTEAVRLSSEFSGVDVSVLQLITLGKAKLMAGDPDGAEEAITTALTRAESAGDADIRAVGVCELARILASRGETGRARVLLDDLDDSLSGLERGIPPYRRTTAIGIARGAVLLAESDVDGAARVLAGTLSAALASYDMPAVARIAETGARIALLRGDSPGAARWLGLAKAIRGVVPLGDPDVRGMIDTLVAALGEPAYTAAFDTGAALSKEQAVAELHDLVGAQPPTRAGNLPDRAGGPPSARPTAVDAHREWEEHHHDARQPGEPVQQRTGDRPAEQ
jgi:predicted ATPase/DNA-binding SARP family transcriptional activator